ncbi:ABC transporter ATP-binding protein [Romboutsia sp.]|uniref:ABC transporter ATP-binding protein n=1 Tax=Romboutsia sp. TaxID=1965302 RepID=UPI003F3F0902
MYIIQTKNLCKEYNHNKVVNNVNLNIKQGEIYGLLGPNGAGKSTLIKMITGLEKPSLGKIVFEEREKNINKYKKHIGLLPQELAIYYDFTARENISFFCSLYGYKGKELNRRVNQSLEFVGLSEYGNKKAGEFSGGMKRRLNMACAISHSPKIIVMDEPTVGIDPQSRNHIIQSVKQLNSQGTTIIYTSHYMEEVEELCNNISIMDNGSIIVSGDIEYLKNKIVKNSVYIITLKKEIEDIETIIMKIPEVERVVVKQKELKCYYSKGANILQKLINTISNQSGIVENIKNEVPTLENVFLTLTGKRLRE